MIVTPPSLDYTTTCGAEELRITVGPWGDTYALTVNNGRYSTVFPAPTLELALSIEQAFITGMNWGSTKKEA